MIKQLLDAGADPNNKNHVDLTPLHMAIMNRSAEAIKQLLDAGEAIRTSRTSMPLRCYTWPSARGIPKR